MVGHTHCDVDQLFSIYAKNLKKKSWNGVDELVTLIRTSYKGISPTIIHNQKKYNWKDWMSEYICSLEGHQKVHHLDFTLNSENRPSFRYAGNSALVISQVNLF